MPRPAITFALTHPDRLVYAEPAITKEEFAEYFVMVAPRMLPHAAGRPLSLLRCPAGAGGKCFYQKRWTAGAPAVDRVRVVESSGRKVEYAAVHDAAGLEALVQFGVMEIHPWGSRADKLHAPDRVIFDLDPGPAVPWSAVIEAAQQLRAVLSHLGLAGWLKTSGGKGLHITVPILRTVTWELASTFARAVSERLERDAPGQFVTVASKSARRGRIFIDHLRNSRGATAVAPWCPRARAGAPVSMPIWWDELANVKSGEAFAMADVVARVRKNARDPWADLPKARQRISRALMHRLAGRNEPSTSRGR